MDRKEAIEIVKSNFPNGRTQLSETLITLIPELESEDERIRKTLIRLFTEDSGEQYDCFTKEQILTWLEKQGKQHNIEYQPHQGNSNNHYDMSFEDAQHYISERGISIPINDGDVFVDDRYITQTIGNIIRWADEHPKFGKQEEQQSLKIAKFKVGDILCRNGYIDHIVTGIYDKCEIPVYICKTDEGESHIEFTDQEKWNLKPNNLKPSVEQIQTLHAQLNEEEIQLLIKDLSARLPYNVKLKIKATWSNVDEFASEVKMHVLNTSILNCVLDNKNIEEVKPYLRPMSSMTAEERREYEKTFEMFDLLYIKSWRTYDWLNEHNFDYRGLIEKGLAIEAPEGMYNN